MKLKDKVAIVTGAARGFGKEFTLAMAEQGAEVVLADKAPLDEIQKVSKEVAKFGRKALPMQVDVTNRDQVFDMVSKVVEEFGKVDILINNAGIYPARPFVDIPVDEWNMVIDVNLNGTFHCSQAAAKEMLKRKHGRIINITSAQALLGLDLMAHYSAAKGAIISFTRALASELSQYGITVNAICPGLTATDGVLINIPKEFQNAIANMQAVRRLGRPEEFRGIVVLLASDDGSFITGETIAVDGGLTNVAAPVSRYIGDYDRT